MATDRRHSPIYPRSAQTFLASLFALSDGSISPRMLEWGWPFFLPGGIGRPVVVFVSFPHRFVAEVGHFHGGRVVQRGTPRLDTGDAHVQAAIYIEIGGLACADRLGKVVGGEKVTATVSGAGCPVMVDGEVGLVDRFDRLAPALFPRFVPDAQPLFVAVTAVLHHPLVAVDADVVSVTAQPAVQGFHHRVVVHPADDHRGGVRAPHVQRLGGVGEIKGDNKAVYPGGPGVGDVHHRGNGVGAVVRGGDPVAPSGLARSFAPVSPRAGPGGRIRPRRT